MGLLKLFNHVATRQLLISRNDRFSFLVPPFTSYDQLTVEYQALSGTEPPWEIIPVASYTPKLGIFKADGTRLAFQDTWTADGPRNVYTGVLSLADAALVAAVDAATPDSPFNDAYLEIKYFDSNGNRHSGLNPTQVLIYKTLLTDGATTVAPTETALTVSMARNMFVPMEGAGAPIIMQSPDGNRWLFYIGNDGKPTADGPL